jgi:hypothetical protein
MFHVCSHRTQNKKQKAPTVHSFLGFPDHLETLKAAVRIISTVHHVNPERNRTKDILVVKHLLMEYQYNLKEKRLSPEPHRADL